MNPLAPSEGKQIAARVFRNALASIDVRRTLRNRLRLEGNRMVFPVRHPTPGGAAAGEDSLALQAPPVVIAFGKAALPMAHTLHEILGGEIRQGLVVAPDVSGAPAARLERFRYVAGGHPYPNAGSLEGGRAALGMLAGLGREDAVIFLVSGGGSALLEQPQGPAVTLADLVEFNRVLVTGGLPIEQINVLRKHVSAVKGGRLALRAFPAAQLTLFISDVPEALDSMVASGPTLPDPSTVGECYAIAAANGLAGRFPSALRRRFEERALEETPKPGDPRFERSRYCRLLSNRDAVEAARVAAEALGLVAEMDRGVWDGDYREVARSSLEALRELAARHPGRPVCLVAGGEVTCPVTGPGRGGRNQAFALYAAGLIAGGPCAVLSAGTDGRDGNSPACGAVADGRTLERAAALGLDPARYLAASNSYEFFRALDDAIETGYTGNNVRDIRLWLQLGT